MELETNGQHKGQAEETVYKLDEQEQILKKGIDLARRGKYKEALQFLNMKNCQKNPMAVSHFAVATVMTDCDKAIEICKESVKAEDHNPEIYMNLGRLYAMANRKDLAFKALEQGLKISPKHQGIMGLFNVLGQRKKPVLPFLSRTNIINKMLGVLAN